MLHRPPPPPPSQSKLANILFSYEMARRLAPPANATVATLHPGLVDTELSRYMLPDQPNLLQRALMAAAKPLALTPVQVRGGVAGLLSAA